MSRKRRIFDIDLPEEDAPQDSFPAGKEAADEAAETAHRRGPMAAAIAETAGALEARAAVEAAIRAENDALAHEFVRLKREGLITDLIPLDQVVTAKLVRDRRLTDDLDIGELVGSIREVGLSNPIRVEPREDGRYELIQGYRRLLAYRELLAETGDAGRWGRIPAGIVARGEALELLYRRMVDENLIRKEVSFAEMAQLALDYCADPGTAENDPDRAVAVLYKSAGYQKRSYIRTFIRVIERLGRVLRYPQHLPRSLGVALAARLDEDPTLSAGIAAALDGWDTRSITDELEVLRRLSGVPDEEAGQGAPAGKAAGAATKTKGAETPARGARTTFTVPQPGGAAKCTAGAGRLEIRLPRDFSAIDRRKLEAGVRALLDRLS